MDGKQRELLRSYMDNIQVNLQNAYYTRVGAGWGERSILPDVTRLYFIREGEGWIRLRGRLYHPRPGQLLLLPAGMRLSFGTNAERPFGKYWCHFTANVGELNLFQLLELPHCIDVRDEAWLETKFKTLVAHFHQPSLTSPLHIKSLLLEIVSSYMEQALEQAGGAGESPGGEGAGEAAFRLTPTAETGKMNTVLHYIEEHLQEQMTVEELARLIHFHPNYFMHYFKTMLGLSPIAYINRKRMEQAKALLTDSDQSVTDVAERVGLELYYFSRLFKKQTGLSPSEYRKHMAAGRGAGPVF